MKHKVPAEPSPPVATRDVNETTAVCPLCNKKVQKLIKHLRITHSVDKNLNPTFKESKFQCKDCGKPCRDRCDLVRHGRTCPPKLNEAAICASCDKFFTSKTNLKRHMKEIHQVTKICDKCKQNFADKNKFLDHLPCKCLCQCGKSFPTLWRFDRHKKSCDGVKPKDSLVKASKSEYQNVISAQCFICKVKDIKLDDVKNHILEFHEPSSEAEVRRCETCDSFVLDVYEHICAKHISIRRFRTSYIQSMLRPHTVFAKKSFVAVVDESAEEPLVESESIVQSTTDVVRSVAKSSDVPVKEPEGIAILEDQTESMALPDDEPECITLHDDEAEGITLPEDEAESITLPGIEADDIILPEDEAEGIAFTEDEAEGTSPLGEAEGITLTGDEAEGISLSLGDAEDIILPVGEAEGMTLPENEAEAIAIPEESDDRVEKSSLFGFDKDLEALLGKESEERADKDLQLDLLDKDIEEDAKATVLLHKMIDKRMKEFQCIITKGEEDRSLSKTRAELVKNISLEEIKDEAEKSLTHIQEIEDGEKETRRKVLFFKSAGHRQLLLYKQIWEPFTEEQFEAALKVLTTWHNARDEKDEQYILNVTLPDLFIHMYQRIFQISSMAESEASIFNTPEE